MKHCSKQPPVTVFTEEFGHISKASLPDPKTQRWVASRKLMVVRAVLGGIVTREEIAKLYSLSDEELDDWIRAVETDATANLLLHRRSERLRGDQP